MMPKLYCTVQRQSALIGWSELAAARCIVLFKERGAANHW
jgi:hypothetical protein